MTACARPRFVEPVPLADLAARLGLPVPPLDFPVRITGISLRSSAVQPGDLYAALPGARTHGARFAADAVSAGAVAVLTDSAARAQLETCGVPVLVAENPRQLLGALSAQVYGDPASAVTVIGVTGTAGKTSTTQLLAAGLTASGRNSAVMGTLGTRIGNRAVATALTTPEAPDVHALLAVMREQGVDVCAMEVSSHALVMGRVDGVRFAVAAFTNFGRDHLDFHGSVEDYFAAKASLFRPERTARGLLNADDAKVAILATNADVGCSTFSPSGGKADWRAVGTSSTSTGSQFLLEGPAGTRIPVSLRLPGHYNIANALCAMACLGEIGADLDQLRGIAAGLATVSGIPGRLEPVDRGQDFSVFVDYAHKPDALAAALSAVRAVTTGQVTVVLGAGGDRDAGKRPLMGSIAAQLADAVFVTDDNPRWEEPARIRAALLAGARANAQGAEAVVEVADRSAAITAALSQARAGDAVLIAGKGHETGQQIGDRVLPFDDREAAAEVLDRLGAGQSP